MDPADKSPTIIVHEESDSLEELSEYLDVLSSSARLRILKFLEKKPRDARAISRRSRPATKHKKTSRQAPEYRCHKKRGRAWRPHVKGLFTRSGNTPLSRAPEAIIRNLGLFSNTRVQVVGSELSRRLDEVKGPCQKKCWEIFLPRLRLAARMTGKCSC